jgi:hypothetical protein
MTGSGNEQKKGESHVMDDSSSTDYFVDTGNGYRFYDRFVHTYPLRGRGCPAGDQSQSRGYDQRKTETCIAQSQPQARSKKKGLATDHFTTNVQRGVTVMKKRNIVVHCLVLLKGIRSIKNNLIVK